MTRATKSEFKADVFNVVRIKSSIMLWYELVFREGTCLIGGAGGAVVGGREITAAIT